MKLWCQDCHSYRAASGSREARYTLRDKPRRRNADDELTHPLLGDQPTLQLLTPRDEVGPLSVLQRPCSSRACAWCPASQLACRHCRLRTRAAGQWQGGMDGLVVQLARGRPAAGRGAAAGAHDAHAHRAQDLLRQRAHLPLLAPHGRHNRCAPLRRRLPILHKVKDLQGWCPAPAAA